MRALLLLLLTLLAGSAAAQASVSLSGCKEGQVDCREECTIEYGGSTRTYDRLGSCLQKCKQKYDKCRENQFKIQEREKLNLAPESSPAAPPPGTERPSEPDDTNWADESRDEAAESPGRRGVFRASESAPEPEPEPTARPESAKPPESQETQPAAKASESKKPEPKPEDFMDTTELDQLFDEQLPPPPQPKTKAKAKAKAEPARSKPPPESQQEDATDWEPNEK